MPNVRWLKNRDKKLCGGVFFFSFLKCGGAKIKSFGSAWAVGKIGIFPFTTHLSTERESVTRFFVFVWCRKLNCQPINCLRRSCLFTIGGNGLQLPEGGDFTHQLSFGGLPSNIHKTVLRSTSPPLLGRCCYKLAICPPSLWIAGLSKVLLSVCNCLFKCR